VKAWTRMVDSSNSEMFNSARKKSKLQTHDKLPYTPFRRRFAEWDYLDNVLIWRESLMAFSWISKFESGKRLESDSLDSTVRRMYIELIVLCWCSDVSK